MESPFEDLESLEAALKRDLALAAKRKEALQVIREWRAELAGKALPNKPEIAAAPPAASLSEAVRRAVAMLTEFDVREIEDYIQRAIGYDLTDVEEPRTKIANVLSGLKANGTIVIAREGKGPVPHRYKRVGIEDI